MSTKAAAREDVARLLEAVKAYRSPKSERATSDHLAELVRLIGEGYDIPEIADRLNVARCTVYRWTTLVKKIAESERIVLQTAESAP
jgi:hypothetical protein